MEVETGKPVRTTRSWFLSILVAVLLSVTMTWFLSKAFRPVTIGNAALVGGCQGGGCCGADTDKEANASTGTVAK